MMVIIKPIAITIEKPPKKALVGSDFISDITNFALKKVNTNNNPVKIYILIGLVSFIIRILNHVQFLPFEGYPMPRFRKG